jgi:hypothetical protein
MNKSKEIIILIESDIGDLIGKALTGEQDSLQKRHELLKAEAIKRPPMKPEDVKTVHDVDVYRYQKAYVHGENTIPSHYATLKELYGEKKADKMMRGQEVGAWKFGGK